MFHAGNGDGGGGWGVAYFPWGQPIKNHVTVQSCILKSNQHGDTCHFSMRRILLLLSFELHTQLT